MRGPRRPTTGYDLVQQAQQIKAITQLSMELRADFALEHIFTLLVQAIYSTLGFKVAALNLVRSESDVVEVVALAGVNEYDGQRLMNNPPSLSRLMAAMDGRFRTSRSYFINHEHKHVLDGVTIVTSREPTPPSSMPDAWHPDDMFLVPLTSLRDGSLLAILSLDQPANGRIPSPETIELAELFADQAALAIENCLLFQEREYRDTSLRQGIAGLIATLDEVRLGNLSARATSHDPALVPLAQSLNSVVAALEGILGNVREAGGTVANHAGGVQATATHLANQTSQRANRMLEVSQEVHFMAESVRQIAETAREANIAALHAIDLSNNGRVSAEGAAEGMQHIRAITLESVKKFERLREAIEEIGALAQTVSEHAQQTNLLTINATLQAMHAGEDGGRGFAVIAKEIRDLAGMTASAARQITGVLHQVQSEAQQTERIITQSSEQVERQSILATEAGAAMDQVDDATQQINLAIRRISETATAQANAALAISNATADIAELTGEDRQSVERMHTAMDHLVGLAEYLVHQVAFFRVTSHQLPTMPGDPAEAAEVLRQEGVAQGSRAPTNAPVRAGEPPLPPLPFMPGASGEMTIGASAGANSWPTRPMPAMPPHAPQPSSTLMPSPATPSAGLNPLGTSVPLPPWLRAEGDGPRDTQRPPEATPALGTPIARFGGPGTGTTGGPVGTGAPTVPRLVPLGDPAPLSGASSPALPTVSSTAFGTRGSLPGAMLRPPTMTATPGTANMGPAEAAGEPARAPRSGTLPPLPSTALPEAPAEMPPGMDPVAQPGTEAQAAETVDSTTSSSSGSFPFGPVPGSE